MISVRDSTRLNVSLDEFLKKIVDPIWLVPPGDLLKFSRWCLSRLNLLENECRFCLAIQIREQRDNEKWTYPFRRNLCRTLDPECCETFYQIFTADCPGVRHQSPEIQQDQLYEENEFVYDRDFLWEWIQSERKARFDVQKGEFCWQLRLKLVQTEISCFALIWRADFLL